MSLTVTGKIERQGFGAGTWALVSDNRETYELKDAPAALQKPDLPVKIHGQIREDVMTIAMIGPVLEVQSFEILSSS
jgi:hypothetical protein